MRVYLDNAATSWPKAESVLQAVETYLRSNGAPAGRGAYAEAADVQRQVARCRRLAAQLIGAEQPERVAFAFNGTDALNIALHGVLREGDQVVTSDAEHNSVLRPLEFLRSHRGVQVRRVPCDQHGRICVDSLRAAITPQTRLVALTHVSNVTGTIQPLAEAAELARAQPSTLLLVDAAQSLGHLPVDVQALGADLLASSGHKGLGGPLGTALLYVGPRAESQLLPLRQGGTGSHSEALQQPMQLPDRLEAGNHNVPGLVGLGAALQSLQEATIAEVLQHERQLTAAMLQAIAAMPGVQLHGPTELDERTGVVSVSATDLPPQELAMTLDSAFRVQVRAGLHCAPLIHRRLGTDAAGGTVRFSVGRFTTFEEVSLAMDALRAVASH
jgi:cysteine desulfurase family protein